MEGTLLKKYKIILYVTKIDWSIFIFMCLLNNEVKDKQRKM